MGGSSSPGAPQGRLSRGFLPQGERGDEGCCLVFGSQNTSVWCEEVACILGLTPSHLSLPQQLSLTRRKLNQEKQTLICLFESLRYF